MMCALYQIPFLTVLFFFIYSSPKGGVLLYGHRSDLDSAFMNLNRITTNHASRMFDVSIIRVCDCNRQAHSIAAL